MSLMPRDTTGLAVIQMLNYKSGKCSAKVFTGPLLLEASSKFNVIEIEGAQSIAATVDFCDVSITKVSIEGFKG